MALESAKKFLADAAEDKSLEAKLDKETAGDKIEGIVAAAKELGYDFTASELKEAAMGDSELSLDELENVAGGGRCTAFGSSKCTCFGSGGGCTCFGSNCKSLFT
jgi:predicted ribosomally synthesized peptide with nif11-like leader